MKRGADLELAYVAVGTDRVEEVAAVLGDVVGMVRGDDGPDGSVAWRNDDRAARVLLVPGGSDDVVALGVDVHDESTLADLTARLARLGTTVERAADELAAARRVDALWPTSSPWGTTIELVLGQHRAADPFSSPLMPSGFLTEGMGFGHAVCFVPDLAVAERFLLDGLGFGRSDRLHIPLGPDVAVRGGFYHCNGRHHTLALIEAPALPPQTLHHVMVEVNDQDDVGAAFDRAHAAGVTIANGIGRHPNDRMVSCYVQTPIGFQVEIGWGGRVVEADWDDDREYDRISLWGHQPVLRG